MSKRHRESVKPESLSSPELSPEELANIGDVIEMNELILTDPDLLVKDEDKPDYDTDLSALTPATTEVAAHRTLWRESEWPQVVSLAAEQYGISPEVIFDAHPEGDAKVIVAEKRLGSAIAKLGIFESSDPPEPGEVPYVLFVTTGTE